MSNRSQGMTRRRRWLLQELSARDVPCATIDPPDVPIDSAVHLRAASMDAPLADDTMGDTASAVGDVINDLDDAVTDVVIDGSAATDFVDMIDGSEKRSDLILVESADRPPNDQPLDEAMVTTTVVDLEELPAPEVVDEEMKGTEPVARETGGIAPATPDEMNDGGVASPADGEIRDGKLWDDTFIFISEDGWSNMIDRLPEFINDVMNDLPDDPLIRSFTTDLPADAAGEITANEVDEVPPAADDNLPSPEAMESPTTPPAAETPPGESTADGNLPSPEAMESPTTPPAAEIPPGESTTGDVPIEPPSVEEELSAEGLVTTTSATSNDPADPGSEAATPTDPDVDDLSPTQSSGPTAETDDSDVAEDIEMESEPISIESFIRGIDDENG